MRMHHRCVDVHANVHANVHVRVHVPFDQKRDAQEHQAAEAVDMPPVLLVLRLRV